MALTGDRNDPFPAFRFRVTFDGLPPAGFSECSGLQVETTVQEYTEGGLNSLVHKFPTRSSQSNVTLRRGIVDPVLWNWYFALTQGDVRRLGGTIAVTDAAGMLPTMVWHLIDALPTKWVGPELSATQSSVAVESLEFSHQGLFRLI